MPNKNLIKNTLKTFQRFRQKNNVDLKESPVSKSKGASSYNTLKSKMVSQNVEKTSKKVKLLETVKKKTHIIPYGNLYDLAWNVNCLPKAWQSDIINISADKVTPVFPQSGNKSNKLLHQPSRDGLPNTNSQIAKSVCSEFIDPHNYANIFGYRHNNAILNPNLTFQGIRRVLHYLKKVVSTNSLVAATPAATPLWGAEKSSITPPLKGGGVPELILVLDSKLNSGSPLRGETQGRAIDLFAYSILRLQKNLVATPDLKINLKTTKDAISYLSTYSGIASINGVQDSAKKPCGVIIINPAKSALCNLADRIFGRMSKKGGAGLSTSNALGYLCAKKGIPLISLCDITSANVQQGKAIYPIFCDTRDINSFYLIFDVLSYGLNKKDY